MTDPRGEAPSEDVWLIWYEDADVKPELFFGAGAEGAARRRFSEALTNWTCHLLTRAPVSATPVSASSERATWLTDEVITAAHAKATEDTRKLLGTGKNWWPEYCAAFRRTLGAAAKTAQDVVLDNLPYLENLINLRGHESALLKNHPFPCAGHDFCLMRQAQKGADAIRNAASLPAEAVQPCAERCNVTTEEERCVEVPAEPAAQGAGNPQDQRAAEQSVRSPTRINSDQPIYTKIDAEALCEIAAAAALRAGAKVPEDWRAVMERAAAFLWQFTSPDALYQLQAHKLSQRIETMLAAALTEDKT